MLDLTGTDFVGQELEYRQYDLRDGDDRIGLEVVINAGEEFRPVTFTDGGRRRRPPLLVIDATQQRRKLRPEVRRLADRQPVAQRLQDRPQQAIGARFIVSPEQRIEIVDPNVGKLGSVIDAFNAEGAQGKPSNDRLLRMKRPRPRVVKTQNAETWARIALFARDGVDLKPTKTSSRRFDRDLLFF